MADLIVNYSLTSATALANPDGTLPAILTNCTEAAGPGATALGTLDKALHFDTGASIQTTLSPGAITPNRFCIRVAFSANGPVTTRQNLVECTALPFAMFLEPGSASDRFNLVVAVANSRVDWAIAHTTNRVALTLNTWYVVSLVYDLDTLALMVDGTVHAVTAFPSGGLKAGSGDKLWIGSWVNGQRWPFKGDIAAVQVYSDIPADLETALDAKRPTPEWFLTHKYNAIRPTLNLGNKTSDFYFDSATGSHVQPFEGGLIAYTEAHGVAFEMHGSIHALYQSDSNLRRSLGALASDEINGRRSGSRKSVFAQGCIYWSPQTGAVPVLGRLYLDYEMLGEGGSAIGLPTAAQTTVPGGVMQQFQGGRMYYRSGASNTFEVHGSILAKYDATGGVTRWGFPVSHESDVRRDSQVLGKVSHFESCTIYWSGATGAHIIYGDIRRKYLEAGGPQGALGFPTSSEEDIPGVAGPARYNTFQQGSILWFNGQLHVCYPFRFFVGRVDTKEEDRDILDLDGQNDIYCRIAISVNGHRVYDKKLPEGDKHFSSANIKDINFNVPYAVLPGDPNLNVQFQVEIWECDSGNLFGGDDDLLGRFTKDLNIRNAWGLRDNANGIFRASNFGPWMNFMDWSIKPQLGANTPLDFFSTINRGTPTVDFREYAAAFGDVDPDWELDFGLIDDGLKALFYELVVKGVAAGGNCFGMATEAIYAYKDMSRLSRPLSRFGNWAEVENDFNVRHTYQVGADAIWWFVGQFLSGKTHNPVSVFQDTWDAHNRGLNPVICLSQNYDFSGAPHCITPIAWRNTGSEMQIDVFDPNSASSIKRIVIDPARNTFRYENGRVYEGGEWSGGRLHYMPFSVLNHRQRTPVWDAIMLLLGGVVLILGDSAETISLTDENGNNLNAFKDTSRKVENLSGKFVPFPGLSGNNPIKGELLLGMKPKRSRLLPIDSVLLNNVSDLGLNANLRRSLGTTPAASVNPSVNANLNVDLGAATRFRDRAALEALQRAQQPTDLDSWVHTLRGVSAGRLNYYLKRPLQALQVGGAIRANDRVTMSAHRLQAIDNEFKVVAQNANTYTLSAVSKLGAGRDFVKVTVENVPAQANQELKINLQPGLNTMDVVANGAPFNATVTYEGRVNDKPLRRQYTVPMAQGMRLTAPNLEDAGTLKVSGIERVLGEVRATQLIQGR
ncbi:hypothetical protein C7293_25025 [filamentous cyanobacterium CCT1]|nr:hypothetical protein C7293_25025 [filamentous cyanobacterium CCT1]PSN80915.1 hypothetical protein C8B47_04145 [filamentous cyanobacterium CCP4]